MTGIKSGNSFSLTTVCCRRGEVVFSPLPSEYEHLSRDSMKTNFTIALLSWVDDLIGEGGVVVECADDCKLVRLHNMDVESLEMMLFGDGKNLPTS